ncbi:MAG: hypothetical protein SCJ94_06830 [Bacillota bacterium]|nr:hypothetical protein [Bacillota bacterium]
MEEKSSQTLLKEAPLLVLPTLARAIGLNEAIVLQQIHYWCEVAQKKRINCKDGYHWVYNSVPQWQKQFPWWSVSTVKRILSGLKQNNLVIVSSSYNKYGPDRTQWYRPNQQELHKLLAKYQFELLEKAKLPPWSEQNDLTYTRDYTENTTKELKTGSEVFDSRLINFHEYAAENEVDEKAEVIIEYILERFQNQIGLVEKLNSAQWEKALNTINRQNADWIDLYIEKAASGKYKAPPGLLHFLSSGVSEILFREGLRHERKFD